MEILSYETIPELTSIGDAWDQLSVQEPRFVLSFSELRHELEFSNLKFRFLVAVDNYEVVGIACYVYRSGTKNYFVADMNLFRLSANKASLVGSCVLGQIDEVVIKQFFTLILDDSSFDLLDLGYVIIGSPLYNAVTKLRGGLIIGRARRKAQVEWLIRLPKTFDDYTQTLGPATQKNAVRNFKKLDQQPAFEVHVIDRFDQIDKFLQDAEIISRLTYQWNLGQKVVNDETTRERLARLAKKKTLRCYIAYLNGQPCAFATGERNRRIFLYQIPGFDPKYADKSPGTALMLWIIRDLIDNTDCEFFDFGMGGNFDYKKRFGNTALKCARLQLGNLYRPYSFFLVAIDQVLNSIKNFAGLVLGQGRLMQRLKRATRRYGDS
jgi:Acetyltransferase (GNAT) domain